MTTTNLSRRSFLKSSTIAATAAAALPLAAAPIAAELLTVEVVAVAAPVDPWASARWWMSYSADETEMYREDFATREEAVRAALAFGEPVRILEAVQGELHMVLDGNQVMEMLAGQNGGMLNDDCDFLEDVGEDLLDDLGARVSAAIADWVRAHGINTTAHAFDRSRNGELIASPADIEGMHTALARIDRIIADPATFGNHRHSLTYERGQLIRHLKELGQSVTESGEPA